MICRLIKLNVYFLIHYMPIYRSKNKMSDPIHSQLQSSLVLFSFVQVKIQANYSSYPWFIFIWQVVIWAVIVIWALSERILIVFATLYTLAKCITAWIVVVTRTAFAFAWLIDTTVTTQDFQETFWCKISVRGALSWHKCLGDEVLLPAILRRIDVCRISWRAT